MAHFAEIDPQGYVIWVLVVDNKDVLDSEGKESEAVGRKFCEDLFEGGRWVQTSYNAKFRGKFASAGDYYDEELDEFV